jgi:hypothetical protein
MLATHVSTLSVTPEQARRVVERLVTAAPGEQKPAADLVDILTKLGPREHDAARTWMITQLRRPSLNPRTAVELAGRLQLMHPSLYEQTLIREPLLRRLTSLPATPEIVSLLATQIAAFDPTPDEWHKVRQALLYHVRYKDLTASSLTQLVGAFQHMPMDTNEARATYNAALAAVEALDVGERSSSGRPLLASLRRQLRKSVSIDGWKTILAEHDMN